MNLNSLAQKEDSLGKLTSLDCVYSLPVFQLNPDSSDINTSSVDINFGFEPNKFILHRAFCVEQLNSFVHTASTKTRSQVRGGGRKPWKQKGTGRARAGSSSSPLWRSGGVTFGPQPRVISKKINNKERSLALKTVLFNAVNSTRLLSIEEDASATNFGFHKTRNILKFLKLIGIDINSEKKVLFIVENTKVHLFQLGTSNLPNVNLVPFSKLSLWDVLWSDFLVIEENLYSSLFS